MYSTLVVFHILFIAANAIHEKPLKDDPILLNIGSVTEVNSTAANNNQTATVTVLNSTSPFNETSTGASTSPSSVSGGNASSTVSASSSASPASQVSSEASTLSTSTVSSVGIPNVSVAEVANVAGITAAVSSGNVSISIATGISTQSSSTNAGPSNSTTQPTTAVSGNKTQPNLPGLPVLPPHDNTTLIFVAKGTYVKTSAPEKSCKQNQDCYNLREPDEWCPLPDQTKYGDKGCFCDHWRNVCTIQRQSEKGEEYSDCGDKATSACAGLKPVVHIQQNKNKRHRV